MTFKIICINVWQGGELAENLLQFLREQDADIVAMQEVYAGTDATLPKNFRSLELFSELGYPYVAFDKTFLDHRDEGTAMQGNAIYSKFPIKSSRAVFYDIPFGERLAHIPENFPITPRNLQHAVIDVAGTDVNVCNTQGIWGTHGGDMDRRIEMAKTIVKEIDGKHHMVLTGDFNFNPGTKAMGLIDEKLRDIFKGELVSTFNMRQKTNPGFATAIVDMMFVSDDIDVVKKDCLDVNVSDHLPLCATLALK